MLDELRKLCNQNASSSSFLVTKDGNVPVPLKQVDLNVNIKNDLASYVMTQQYVNIEDVPLETVYLFPMDVKAVISKLTCEFTLPDGSSTMILT
jgi:hypothetical protein